MPTSPLGMTMVEPYPLDSSYRKGGVGMGNEKEKEQKGKIFGMGGCLPKTSAISVIQIRSEQVRGNIEQWKEKALIGKFVGVWPKERDLVRWISSVWNSTGHYDLNLGSKGFFTIIFFN